MKKLKRCRHDIIYDILKTLSENMEGVYITEVCMKANLPVDRGNKLLRMLTDKGLAYSFKEGKRRKYFVTDLGYEYMGIFLKLKEILQENSQFVS